MRLIRSSMFSPSSLPQRPTVPRRHIHNPIYIPKGIKHLTVMGNNSILFATLSALKHFGKEAYPKITVVCPDFWLDKVHHECLEYNWGQTAYGLPNLVREIFFRYHPNYPDNKLINWGEYQQVRMMAMEELASFPNVDFHQENPLEVIKKNDTFEILLHNKKLSVPSETFFYLWYRSPRMVSDIKNSHVKLYELPPVQAPNPIIAIGHGLSFVWLLRHFPDRKIINIKRPSENIPEVPANSDIDLGKEIDTKRLIIYTNKEVDLRFDEKGEQAVVISSKSGEILHEGHVYAATGFLPDHSLLKSVPDNNKILMPYYDEKGKQYFPTDVDTIKLLEDKFVSPRNIPEGSLAHSYTALMELTKNISWTSEPMFYFKKSQHELLKTEFEKIGIKLSLSFFDKLDNEILKAKNPQNAKKSLELYLKIFKETHNPSPLEIELFRKTFKKYFENHVTQEHNEVETSKVKMK